jgi:hypothetical protein
MKKDSREQQDCFLSSRVWHLDFATHTLYKHIFFTFIFHPISLIKKDSREQQDCFLSSRVWHLHFATHLYYLHNTLYYCSASTAL